jgi:ferritin
MVDALKLIGDNGIGVYMMDKELATRSYTPLNSSQSSQEA